MKCNAYDWDLILSRPVPIQTSTPRLASEKKRQGRETHLACRSLLVVAGALQVLFPAAETETVGSLVGVLRRSQAARGVDAAGLARGPDRAEGRGRRGLERWICMSATEA